MQICNPRWSVILWDSLVTGDVIRETVIDLRHVKGNVRNNVTPAVKIIASTIVLPTAL